MKILVGKGLELTASYDTHQVSGDRTSIDLSFKGEKGDLGPLTVEVSARELKAAIEALERCCPRQ